MGVSKKTVLYWLCGAKYAETLAVSMYHLRQHWAGDVAICYAVNCKDRRDRDAAAKNIGAAIRLGAHFHAATIPVNLPKMPRHDHYVGKASLWRHVDGQVILLDADTVPVAPLDDLFTDYVTVTQFSDWVTTGKTIGRRMQSFLQHLGEHHALQFDPQERWPAINTGVVAWGERGRRGLELWETFTRAGWSAPFTDELALQYCLPTLFRTKLHQGTKIERDDWNFSPLFGRTKPPRIYHFHGRKHIRDRHPSNAGPPIWEPLAIQALRNTPGLVDWWGEFDPAVKCLKEVQPA